MNKSVGRMESLTGLDEGQDPASRSSKNSDGLKYGGYLPVKRLTDGCELCVSIAEWRKVNLTRCLQVMMME